LGLGVEARQRRRAKSKGKLWQKGEGEEERVVGEGVCRKVEWGSASVSEGARE
jgi:hypothetical protein